MTISVYRGDLPAGLDLGPAVAVDTEAMGLDPHRDRLCLVQLCAGDGNAHLVQIENPPGKATRLKRLMADRSVTKLFHFARFDVAMISRHLGVETAPIYCTKIASRLGRTYTDKHGLKDLCRELLGIDLSKQQQSSDWGASELSEAQRQYAAQDVLHLHALRASLDAMLEREGRATFAAECFAFLPTRARLDLAGWSGDDIFAH